MSVSREEFRELKITIEDMQAQIAGYKRYLATDRLLARLLVLAGDLELTGGLNLTGDLAVVGDTDLTGALDVTGATTLDGGDLDLTGNLLVTGDTTLDGGDLDVTGNAEITGNTTLNGGNLGLTGDLNVTGDTDLTGALDVTGTITLDGGNVGLTGDLNVTGDFGLTGDQIVKGASRVIRGDGSNFPDLGSTTAAEQLGYIYQALARDIYPDGETNIDAGFWTRFVNRYGIAGYTTHAREGEDIPTGLTAWQELANVYVASDPTYTGYLRGTYYQMMPENTAPLRAFLADTGTQPITTAKWQVGRFLTTGGMVVGLRADNYDSDRSYAVNERLHYYEIILYGLAPRTQLLYNKGYYTWNGSAWTGPTNTAGTAVTLEPMTEAITIAMYINYGVNSNTVAGYVVGENGKVSSYGSDLFYVGPGAANPFGARCAGPTARNRVYVGCGFDWWHKTW